MFHLVQENELAALSHDFARRGGGGLELGKLLRRRDEIGGRHIARRHARLQRGVTLDDGVDLAFGNVGHVTTLPSSFPRRRESSWRLGWQFVAGKLDPRLRGNDEG